MYINQELKWKSEALDRQPVSWRFQNLVVQDPFVPTYVRRTPCRPFDAMELTIMFQNHAASVSAACVRYFEYNCALAAKSLSHGHPLHNILGPHFVPLTSYRGLAKKLETQGLSPPPRRPAPSENLRFESEGEAELATRAYDGGDKLDTPRYQERESQERPGQEGKVVERRSFGLKPSTRRYYSSSAASHQEIPGLNQVGRSPCRGLN
jgi:hypothetical protein